MRLRKTQAKIDRDLKFCSEVELDMIYPTIKFQVSISSGGGGMTVGNSTNPSEGYFSLGFPLGTTTSTERDMIIESRDTYLSSSHDSGIAPFQSYRSHFHICHSNYLSKEMGC
eukprot:sb/3476925/